MLLRGRVGRHTKTGGRQCQNWSEDQQTVIALLNRIPARDGGAEGSLGGRTIAGISSDALYQAISRFEDMHFPGQRSGFVDPGGAMLRRMEALAARTATAQASSQAPAQAPAPTPASTNAIIQIPPLLKGLSPAVLLLLQQIGFRAPSQARRLDASEVTEARQTYGDSLVYDAIYVSDGIGASGRPFTMALPTAGGVAAAAGAGRHSWIVVLNLGPSAFQTPNLNKFTLIHELAHAWQSQHHPQPWQFMVNCVKSQAAAEVATAANHPLASLASPIPGVLQVLKGNRGDASAYAYLPGKSFGDYGGEQIAQQVEDTLSGGSAGALIIRDRMRSIPAGRRDPENIRSLSTVRYEYKNTPYVVWH